MIERPPENKALKAPLTVRVADREPVKATKVPASHCPRCGAECVERERGPDGNDMCANGHVYPTKSAVPAPDPETIPPPVAVAVATAPRAVGHGACPKCGGEGPIYADGVGMARKLVYGGCKCRNKVAWR